MQCNNTIATILHQTFKNIKVIICVTDCDGFVNLWGFKKFLSCCYNINSDYD